MTTFANNTSRSVKHILIIVIIIIMIIIINNNDNNVSNTSTDNTIKDSNTNDQPIVGRHVESVPCAACSQFGR